MSSDQCEHDRRASLTLGEEIEITSAGRREATLFQALRVNVRHILRFDNSFYLLLLKVMAQKYEQTRIFVELELEASELQVCNLMSSYNLVPAEVLVLGGVLADDQGLEDRRTDPSVDGIVSLETQPIPSSRPKVFPTSGSALRLCSGEGHSNTSHRISWILSKLHTRRQCASSMAPPLYRLQLEVGDVRLLRSGCRISHTLIEPAYPGRCIGMLF